MSGRAGSTRICSHRSVAIINCAADGACRPRILAVLYIGRIAPEKNIDTAFNAFAKIRAEQLPGARMILVGSGPAEARLRDAHPDAVFAGPQIGDSLARHYASGDLFLFPSQTETFGNVTLEAMASGLPVVSYDLAAAHELIEHGRNGLLADPANEAEFIAQQADAGGQSTVLCGGHLPVMHVTRPCNKPGRHSSDPAGTSCFWRSYP
jgi:glycosyltransferase involved in cell wall biosynthesis